MVDHETDPLPGLAAGVAGSVAAANNPGDWVPFGANLADFSFKTFVDAAAASAAPSMGATLPPTISTPVGQSRDGGPALPLIVACFAATAAFVTLRRYAFAPPVDRPAPNAPRGPSATA